MPSTTHPHIVGNIDRQAIERVALHLWSLGLGTVLLIAHLFGILITGLAEGFHHEFETLAYMATACGLVAVPLCSWQASRRLDQRIEAFSQRPLVAIPLRLIVGTALVAFVPAVYQILADAPLPLIRQVLVYGVALLSIAVMTGLVMVSLGVADLLYWLTAHVQYLSTRLMVLLFVSSLAHFFWLSLIGLQLRELVLWAIEQGQLEEYVTVLENVSSSASFALGGVAGVVVVEIPFLLIVAWRFGRLATRGLYNLRKGFERVADGDFDHPVSVHGSDEVARMQRGFNQMLNAARERYFLESAFGRYVSPVVLERIRERGDSEMMTGERRVATVLFSDICGFTAMSASLAPEQVIGVLNSYMSLMIETIARYDGYINKFVGDAIMVVWNAPLDQKDHALRALACAEAMAEELQRANEAGVFGPVEQLEMSIGINTGPLVAGNLGNERQVEFTVLGDTVNVASRACSHAGADEIIMTSYVIDAAQQVVEDGTNTSIEVSSKGLVEVKGKGKLEFFALGSLDSEAASHLSPGVRDSILPPEPETLRVKRS